MYAASLLVMIAVAPGGALDQEHLGSPATPPGLGPHHRDIAVQHAAPASEDACKAPFFGHLQFYTGGTPESATLADLDNDGDLDLVTGYVCTRMNPGNGLFEDQVNYYFSGAIRLADVNGDDFVDLGVYNQEGIWLSLNDGQGAFPRLDPVFLPYSTSFVWGDADDDGDVDLVVGQAQWDRVALIRNTGEGGFGGPQHFDAYLEPWNLALADLTGDDVPEVLVTSDYDDHFSVLLNDGSGFFHPPVTYATGDWPQEVEAADLDLDGDRDVVVLNFASDDVSVYLNGGDGNLGVQQRFPCEGDGALGIELVDVNLDAIPDVVTQGRNLSVIHGNGDGTFGAPLTYPVGPLGVSLDHGDVNGDGLIDILVGRYHAPFVSLLLGQPGGSFGYGTTYDATAGARAAVSGDADDDGDLDLVIIARDPDFVQVLLDGDGGFIPGTQQPLGASPSCIGLGDVNRDGLADAVVGYFSDEQSLSLLLGAGGGSSCWMSGTSRDAPASLRHVLERSPVRPAFSTGVRGCATPRSPWLPVVRHQIVGSPASRGRCPFCMDEGMRG